MRSVKQLQNYDLDTLAIATNGNCALLSYNLRKPHPTLFDAPDLTNIPLTVEVETQYCSPMVRTVSEAHSAASEPSEILALMSATPAAVKTLADATVGQSTCGMCESQRIGRLTSSRIGTCVHKVSDDLVITGTTHSVIANVMGYYEKPRALPLEWGSKQEPRAIQLYTVQQKIVHKRFKVTPTGLWIYTEAPFVASSPDGLVCCSCCGKGCLEVKSPWIGRNQSVTTYLQRPNGYVCMTDGIPTLKCDHPYYAQVQTHMLCTDTQWCDLVVFTAAPVDNMLIFRVPRDTVFLTRLLEKAAVFFWKCIVPEIETCSVQKKVCDHYVRCVLDTMLNKLITVRKVRTQISFVAGVLHCGSQEISVQCNTCEMWFHYKCANLKGDEKLLKINSEWYCELCSMNTQI